VLTGLPTASAVASPEFVKYHRVILEDDGGRDPGWEAACWLAK
jgi:hypothetical protein